MAPILNLKNECDTHHVKYDIIIGARSGDEHFMDHEPEKNIILSTDDGTIGVKGTVMVPLEKMAKENENPYLFACGPEPMLEAVRNFALSNHIPAQLAVESYMGCGVGLCQGCVIHRQNGGNWKT